MKSLTTIILAAGRGVRMRSAVPKVLHPVAGRPIIHYVLDVARRAGSLKTYVVLGHQQGLVRKQLPKDATIAVQKKLLGTADAVRTVAARLSSGSGDVLILCGDTPLLQVQTIKKLLRSHRVTGACATVLTAIVADPRGYGRIVRDPEGSVLAIREDKDATAQEKEIPEINTGVYCFRGGDLLRGLKGIRLNEFKKEFYLTDIIENLEKEGKKISAVVAEDPLEGLGINSRVELSVAERLMRERILKQFMLDGVGIVDPATTYIAADAKIGRDTVIKPFTVIEENVRIGNHCQIGPFAHLRPGTRLADGVEIGNFTEVSRSSIGPDVRMKHFSFMGDAVVGAASNIGAGVVTANYDGRDKNQTLIGKQAFIGSDSILVAPVKIGAKAMTGAGSVVPAGKNIPAGKIAVGVPARVLSRRKNS